MTADEVDVVIAVATIGTALGTLALAASTAWLSQRTSDVAKSSEATAKATLREVELVAQQADATRSQAEATARQSEIAEATLGASIRPLLVDVPHGLVREVAWLGSGAGNAIVGQDTRKIDVSRVAVDISSVVDPMEVPGVAIEVPIRNVGVGPAMIRDVSLGLHRDDRNEIRVVGTPERSVLPTGEVTNLKWTEYYGSVGYEDLVDAVTNGADLVVRVIYCDLAGQQSSTTTVFVGAVPDSGAPPTYETLSADISFVSDPTLGIPWMDSGQGSV